MTRFHQLKEFCTSSLPAIKPKLVLATGDLTDAKTDLGSRQHETEWKMYAEILSSCKAMKNVQWLDLKGNHDNFNVNGHNSSENFYRQYGAQGKIHGPGSYMVTVPSSKYTKYAFIGVDATLDLGPKRILNFVGHLDNSKMAKLEQMQWMAEKQMKVNASVWFGHYPSSSIVSAAPGLRSVASKAVAYLCGHFHSFYGVVPQMYTKHHSGLMELELADWKMSRMYRVAVLDQGLFSFSDVVFDSWPVVVVSNPKAAFLLSHEPFDSTHIRLFIFSPSTITQCQVRIDDEPWRSCHLTGLNHPLWTAPWDPDQYATGLHTLQVRASDRSGFVNQISHQFSLDGSQPLFPLLPRLFLMVDLTSVAQVLFGVAIATCILPLCVARVVHHAVLQRRIVMHRFSNRFVRSWLKKLWIVATVDCLFYPIVCFTFYLVGGPWWIGDLIDGNTAIVFAWGIVFDAGAKFLPGTTTYLYGFAHLLLYNGPLILVLGHTADLTFRSLTNPVASTKRPATLFQHYLKYGPFILFMIVQLALLIPFWIGNGTMAFLLSPMRLWSVILAVFLWNRARSLSSEQLASVAKVWK